MNKKILTLLMLLMAVSTISIVCAANTQNIGGFEFNVPEGYAFDSDATDMFSDSMDNKTAEDVGVFKNTDGESIIIMVYNENPGDLNYPDDYEFENKTIAGKNGTVGSASSRINIVFMYEEGGKFIVIQAMDEATIEETIK